MGGINNDMKMKQNKDDTTCFRTLATNMIEIIWACGHCVTWIRKVKHNN